jgi:hypothetical protein
VKSPRQQRSVHWKQRCRSVVMSRLALQMLESQV